MSNKERAIELLNQVPEYKMGYVLAYIQGITADEEADDIFCQRIVENFENDPDPEKDKTYTLEECKKEWGGLIDVSNHPKKESKSIIDISHATIQDIIHKQKPVKAVQNT